MPNETHSLRYSTFFVGDARGLFCRDCCAIVDVFVTRHGWRCDDCYGQSIGYAPRAVRVLARDLHAATLELIR